ncbi:HD domain-containing protein [Geobacter hydrogenophilus]|uniref:HD family phosphohydrolase n=1 Tax=Geobacter hydrogenophilus TaxID=40983 RepID=A0A9W6LDL4_9BACT|nr:HD domain-containing protein [Geobacter hydrogenophilus]MBT0892604.1 HD domain-containing protein [Geobacter hydrogenophilus]GLI40002.1 HD family phosphohydrolase [Geobacter hydrogenophilus]
MNKVYVSSIRDRDQLESVFLVKDKIMAMAKNGKPYMTLKLMDKTGEIEGRVWDNVDELSAIFDRDDFIAIRCKASVYLGKMQLIISELMRVPDDRVQLADFLPESDRPVAEMEQELAVLLASFTDPHLKALMDAFFGDAELMALYRIAPAAKGMHHVYLGGLLEHSLAVARLVDVIIPLYGGLNRDLLVAGALLHDVGKVREMTYQRSFDYTDEGKLLGHITIGVEMVQERIAAIPGFPTELAMLLKHMLLSHHGQYEYGSPKRPKTVEATILNYLDDLDSKINGIRTHIRKEAESQSRWSSYHRLYDRYFYKENYSYGEEYDEAAEAEAEGAAPEPPVQQPAAAPESPAAPVPHPRREEQKKKGFHNNPFEQLQGKNLDLFNQ